MVGFLFKNDKVVKSTATMDDLEDTNKQIKVVGQIVHLKMSSSTMQSWDWTKRYVALDIDSRDQNLTHRQYVVEVTSSLICPLTPSVVQRPLPGSTQDISDYPWRVSATELQFVLKFLWDSLEPESEKILGNVELLHSINNSALPYHDINGNESLMVEDVPNVLTLRQKLSGKDKVPCLLCGQKEISLKDMQKHVGGHILCDLCDCAVPDECKLQAIGENTCGFCGLHGCLTQLLKNKHGGFTITSTCTYYYAISISSPICQVQSMH